MYEPGDDNGWKETLTYTDKIIMLDALCDGRQGWKVIPHYGAVYEDEDGRCYKLEPPNVGDGSHLLEVNKDQGWV